MIRSELIKLSIIKILSRLLLNQKKDLGNREVTRFLIVCHFGIGDAIFFFPLLRQLISINPNSLITVIVQNKTIYEIFKNNFNSIELIIYEDKSIKNRIYLYNKLKKKKYQVFLTNFLGHRKEYILLALFCKIPYRVGHLFGEDTVKTKFNFFFNYGYYVEQESYFDINKKLIEPFSLEPINEDFQFTIDENSNKLIGKFIAQNDLQPYIIMQVYSSVGPLKNWLPERFVNIAEKIQNEFSINVVLIGSSNERDEIDRIFMDSQCRYLNTAGQFSVMETAALVKNAILFLGNDGGIGKIAVALDIPTITIWGSSDFIRAKSWKEGSIDLYNKIQCAPCVHVIGKPNKNACDNSINLNCLKLIEVENVFNKVKKILNN